MSPGLTNSRRGIPFGWSRAEPLAERRHAYRLKLVTGRAIFQWRGPFRSVAERTGAPGRATGDDGRHGSARLEERASDTAVPGLPRWPGRSWKGNDRKPVSTWLTDMDGVLIHEGNLIPGADEFIRKLRDSGTPFLVLTNNSIYTARDLRARLLTTGIDLPEESIWTSALATANFLHSQRPGGSAYVIGEAGLTTALHEVGYTLSDTDPDYVVLGETRTYSFEAITRAIRLIDGGARFIATNPDATGPSLDGALPACGSVAALITRATGIDPYFVGKPNPVMMREGLNQINAHSESTAMIGDRMDTDIKCGIEAGLETILVMTGISGRDEVERYPFRPSRILDSVADLMGEL